MIYRHAYDLIHDDDFLMLSSFTGEGDVFLKIEGLNVAGSIKLKTAVSLLDSAERAAEGRLSVIESTSGNLGVALASVCAARGHELTLVTDPNTSREAMAKAEALGARIVCVSDRDDNGGYLGTRIAYIQARLRESPGVVWLNQYANSANPAVHSARTAPAILREFPAVDYLFVGAGTTGTLMGCVNYFRVHRPATKIVAVDTVGSISFSAEPGPRHIPGIGMSVKPRLLVDDGSFEKILIPETDAIRVCRLVAAQYGLLAGGSTGSVLAAVQAYEPRLRAGATVVAISPDLGDKYLASIYDDAWVAEKYESVTTA